MADAVLHALPAAQRDRVEARAAPGAVTMADSPVRAASRTTSIRAAAGVHAAGEAHAVVSAGSSGATVTAAVLELGRAQGVRTPPLAVWIPTLRPGHEVLLLDVGGSVESSAAVLLSHAALGAEYWRRFTGGARPRIGLLSVGREPGKGDRLRRAAEQALRAVGGSGGIPAEFVGLVEGDDVCVGARADVVVTDGFTGNVLLKGIEGAYRLATAGLREQPREISGMARAAALLGVPGVVVVCHGAADAADVASGVAFAARLARLGPAGGHSAGRTAQEGNR